MTKKSFALKSSPVSKPVVAKHKSASASYSGRSKSPNDVKKQILEELGKMLFMGKKSVKAISLAKACGYASTDSKGFRNPLKALKEEGKIQKEKDMVSLTVEMMEEFKRQQPELPKAATNAERHDQIKEMFKDDKYHKNIVKLIDLLADGQSMIPKDLAVSMGYAHVDSRGYRDPKNILLEHDIVEMQQKKIQLTDHLFPEGRPCHE